MASQHPLIGSIAEATQALKACAAERLFLVVDEPAYEASGADRNLGPFLADKNTTWFTKFELNPKLEDVQRGIEAYQACDTELVIALGGGTAIDLAKLISSIARQTESAHAIATGAAPISASSKPLMAIPTTAGTGSESTQFAVVYVDGQKYSVSHPSLLPTYAVVDPTLTASLPKRITAATGLDAFCQAIESIWSVAATEESLGYATEAGRLAYENLLLATESPTPESRKAMCRASHLAGKAINITKTTAPHALSYALTSQYGVPHGMAVAVTLAPMLGFNAAVVDSDCNDPRGAEAVRRRIAQIVHTLNAESVDEACAAISKLTSAVGCPTLNEIGAQDNLGNLADSVNAERLSNNPRRASREQLKEILQSAA